MQTICDHCGHVYCPSAGLDPFGRLNPPKGLYSPNSVWNGHRCCTGPHRGHPDTLSGGDFKCGTRRMGCPNCAHSPFEGRRSHGCC